jgi:hypothetical protein
VSDRSFEEFLIALEEQEKESLASFDEVVNSEIRVIKPAISEHPPIGQATELRPNAPATARRPARTATWELEVIHGLDAGRRYPLTDRVSLGRDWNADIALNDQQVSRRHAQIQRAGDDYQIVDQGSSNGTFVNGVLISMPTRLKAGDEVRMGDTRLVLRGPQSKVATNTLVQASPAAVDPSAAPKKFCTKCGARLKSGKRFCTGCGARFV